MSFLTKEQIESASDRPTKVVKVPEWGGEVIVGTMDGGLLARYEQMLRDDPGGFARLRAVVVSLCVVDETGNAVFTPEDVEWLHGKSGPALDRIFAVAIRLNRLRKKDMEDLEKNCETGPSAGSCSASPSNNDAPSEPSNDGTTPPTSPS